MRYYSTDHRAPEVGFREAVLAGLAPDGGLYLPGEVPALPVDRAGLPFAELASRVLSPFVAPEIDDETLQGICERAFDFPIELVEVVAGVHALELFWGPTFAFKDFGARFLARVTNYFAEQEGRHLTILVATSGDTGSAVAQGFLGMPAIDVVLLYPSGRVSPLQEKQLTTVGGNVAALEVDGTFDDCQQMVKAVFADREVVSRRPLSSANSINIGRLLPQIIYYVLAVDRLRSQQDRPPVVCVPSGNYGNVTGALLATMMGLEVDRLVVASNANDVVPRFLQSGHFEARGVVATPANAMDVGLPSNLARIRDLLDDDLERMRAIFKGHRVTTEEIFETIRTVREQTGYLLDPHTAVGYAALSRYFDGRCGDPRHAVLVATAHPAKFGEAILEATGESVEIPDRLAAAIDKEKHAVKVANHAAALKSFLMETAPSV